MAGVVVEKVTSTVSISGDTSVVWVAGANTLPGADAAITPLIVIGAFVLGGGMNEIVVASWLTMNSRLASDAESVPSDRNAVWAKVTPAGAVKRTPLPRSPA